MRLLALIVKPDIHVYGLMNLSMISQLSFASIKAHIGWIFLPKESKTVEVVLYSASPYSEALQHTNIHSRELLDTFGWFYVYWELHYD